jgi:hypothetical protein
MTPSWEQLRNTEGLRLGPAAFRWQSCVRCNAEIDTLLDDGVANHRDFDCQPSFKTTLNTYDQAVQRALRGL